MKTRLNLTIEESLLTQIKTYAAEKQVSISELVEQYFKRLTNPDKKKKNLIELIESLPKPDIDLDVDLKKQYYEERASKYGF